MRKLILISAFVLASVSAQAADRDLILAANDTPAAAATTATPDTAKPEAAKTDVTKTEEAKPEAAKADVKADASRKQASSSRKTHVVRYYGSYEGDEAKARRIASHYGVYW